MSIIDKREEQLLLADYVELFTSNLKTKSVLPSSLPRSVQIGIRQQARIKILASQSIIPIKTVEYGSGSVNGWSYG